MENTFRQDFPQSRKKKSYPMPSQPNFLLRWKILPFDKKVVSDHISVPDKRTALPWLTPVLAAVLSRTTLLFPDSHHTSQSHQLIFDLNNKITMNYEQAQAVTVGSTTSAPRQAVLCVRNSINNKTCHWRPLCALSPTRHISTEVSNAPYTHFAQQNQPGLLAFLPPSDVLSVSE